MIDMRINWPNGARVAVMLTFDFDAETLWLSRDPANAKRPGTLSQGTYGAKVAVPKILEVLKEAGVRGTFFVPGWTAEHHTGRVEMILREGHEVAHHSYSHRWIDPDFPDQEIEEMEKGLDALKRTVGVVPKAERARAVHHARAHRRCDAADPDRARDHGLGAVPVRPQHLGARREGGVPPQPGLRAARRAGRRARRRQGAEARAGGDADPARSGPARRRPAAERGRLPRIRAGRSPAAAAAQPQHRHRQGRRHRADDVRAQHQPRAAAVQRRADAPRAAAGA